MPTFRQRRPLMGVSLAAACLLPLAVAAQDKPKPHQPEPKPHNIILFVADGLRRNSVTADVAPALLRVRTEGTDFRNSHSVFPTFTTANGSVIATGHALGDTGDYSNTLWPGAWLSRPDPSTGGGWLVPFLENDEILADMNARFHGNYLGERTLLSVAREHGFNVASVGKLGPTAIQQIDALAWDPTGFLDSHDAIIVDDATGSKDGIALPIAVQEAMEKAGVATAAPSRSNGYADTSHWSNGFSGDPKNPGTLAANHTQQTWFADVATRVLLPMFTRPEEGKQEKPFVLLFWSRDPDGTQHNQGDSLQQLDPGVNGATSLLGVRNADRALGQLLAWLDAHPAIKATTDVVVTSDHGFATITRREVAEDGTLTAAPSSNLQDPPPTMLATDRHDPEHTLPQGFLALDLGTLLGLHVFDANVRSTTTGSLFAEVPLVDKYHFPSGGNALLGDSIQRLDGSDAKYIVAANGGSDLLYVPSKDPRLVKDVIATLATLDYVGGIFADSTFCPTLADCPGALPLTALNLEGKSDIPRPAVVVAFKHFYRKPGDLQTGVQIADTNLQEGQGQHGGFARDQTFNNMAALGPDFKPHFADESPTGNIDIVPTLAHILGIDMPSNGNLRGRIATEALTHGSAESKPEHKTETSAPTTDGKHTILEYQELNGVRYFDQACLVDKAITHCP